MSAKVYFFAFAHAFGMSAREHFAAGKISLTSRSDVTHSSPVGDTFPSQYLTFGSSSTVIFDQVRKALVRSTLGQNNADNVKRDPDHRDPFSR